jgi:large subunit ribosomal protein L17
MFRNMVTSLFKFDRITTTDPKAKELRRWADQLITLAKRGDLHARRQAMAIIQEKAVVHKLFHDAPQRFTDRSGGYTRLVKVGYRPGDAATLAMVELTGQPVEVKKDDEKEKKKAVKADKKAPKPEA